MPGTISQYLDKRIHAAPLAVFRIGFGLLMLISIIRFAANGWISKLYLEPAFHFSYLGFEWVEPIGPWTYLLFGLCGLSALSIALGYKYRISAVLFFLSFSYIELMDKTTYLNHYYFISILSFLMIFLPAHTYFSVDAKLSPKNRFEYIPAWSVHSLMLLISIVYFYAGLAKLNSDWLFEAMPLQIWLPAKYSIPFLGDLLQQPWVHYLFSWSGALYDLTIPFLLLWRKTRPAAFFLVVVFHILTRVLFPIGMFPYIMIVSALIFFEPDFHKRLLARISRWSGISLSRFNTGIPYRFVNQTREKALTGMLIVFFVLQLLIPFRHLLYPGELFWTEEGYRFSWRVMLMEKAGYAQFKVVNPENGEQFYVDNTRFLTRFQEKQMATQPDFILEYAHYLEDYYQQQGIRDPEIYVESYVALNGRPSKPYINPDTDLSKEQRSLAPKSWILPFNDEIKGL